MIFTKICTFTVPFLYKKFEKMHFDPTLQANLTEYTIIYYIYIYVHICMHFLMIDTIY